MHRQNQDDLIDAIIEHEGLSLEQLTAICSVNREWVEHHIAEGLLEPLPKSDDKWRFSSTSVTRVRRIVLLERDFEAVPVLAALVADMQEEIDELRRRLQRAGLE